MFIITRVTYIMNQAFRRLIHVVFSLLQYNTL